LLINRKLTILVNRRVISNIMKISLFYPLFGTHLAHIWLKNQSTLLSQFIIQIHTLNAV